MSARRSTRRPRADPTATGPRIGVLSPNLVAAGGTAFMLETGGETFHDAQWNG
ncbi:MAG TPA: hypothetical protein VNO30_17870 [Kofleriaceae bacterium]|nr:hypothetical protein [Kofleriaceae bacterium]